MRTRVSRPRARERPAPAEIPRRLPAALDGDHGLGAVARAAADVLGARFAALWTADEPSRTLVGTAASDEAMWQDCPIRTLSFDGGAFGHAARTRRITNVPDVFAVNGIDTHEWLRRHGLRSGYAMPIVVGGSLLGILGAAGACPFRPRRADQEILAGLAERAGSRSGTSSSSPPASGAA
jgi:GAF domain-containing protein